MQFIRLVLQEARLARVPNQLISDKSEEGNKDKSDEDVIEQCASGGTSLSSGNVQGLVGNWGVGYGSSFPKKRRRGRSRKK